MKLNNRQIEAIASEISEILNDKRDKEIKDWEDNVFPNIFKTLKATKTYKEIVKLFSNPFLHTVKLSTKVLETEGFKTKKGYYNIEYWDLIDLNCFDEAIKNAELYSFKQSLKEISKSKIERDIVLESINTLDKDELINKLIAKY